MTDTAFTMDLVATPDGDVRPKMHYHPFHMGEEIAMPKFKGRYQPKRRSKVGEFFAGHRVVGITHDGVRILEPVVGPESFTREECRAMVEAAIKARKAAA